MILKIALSLLIISSVSLQSITEEENVLVLTDANFEEAIANNPKILVEFYAPWCGHCKSLAPEYASAATTLKNKNSDVKLAKVDATKEKKLAEKFNIEGFPTLKFFNQGKDTEYTGGRKAAEIISWLEKKAGPAVTFVETRDKLQEIKDANNVVVAYFGNDQDSTYNTFKSVAENDEGTVYIRVEDIYFETDVLKGDIVVFKKFDEKRNIYDRNAEKTEEKILDFIKSSSIPLVSPFNESTAEFIFGGSKTGIFLYRNAQTHTSVEEIFKSVAPQYKGEIFFVATGITEELEERLAEYIGVTEKDLPVIKIHQVGENDVKKFTLNAEHTAENIKKFIDDFKAGKLQPEFKSEEIPATQDADSSVVKVVGLSWDSIVKDSTKDVVVMFYAPWCGHCKSLHPKYENVANRLKSVSTLVFAKIDATLNEVDGESIDHYPTLRFYAAGNKTADEIEARSEYDIVEFLKSKTLLTAIPSDVVFEKSVEDAAEEHDHSGHDHDHDHDHDHEHEEEEQNEIKPDL